ncbi:MAG: hypothetical protein GY816_03085 [Cytophagales bacterium]|nr:hypothetical protein [Cytophagales bacterium]
MNLKVGDIVKQFTNIKERIGTIIYVYEDDLFITHPDGKKIWYAGPGDVTVNFDSPVRDDRGSVLNEAELERVSQNE